MGTSQKFVIIKDRVDVYKDFTLNLLYYIHHYYIDKESLSIDEDIYNHYNWCFNKVCDEFLKEDIDFRKNKVLRDYFYKYYYHQFYNIKTGVNQEMSLDYYEKFWKNIFEIEKQKNKSLLNILIEIYNIFDISINQEKNILEMV